jgi:hypothetical protein
MIKIYESTSLKNLEGSINSYLSLNNLNSSNVSISISQSYDNSRDVTNYTVLIKY